MTQFAVVFVSDWEVGRVVRTGPFLLNSVSTEFMRSMLSWNSYRVIIICSIPCFIDIPLPSNVQ